MRQPTETRCTLLANSGATWFSGVRNQRIFSATRFRAWFMPSDISPMTHHSPDLIASEPAKTDEVFEMAAELFRVMSAPMRLKIIHCLRDGERNVSYLLSQIDTTQPNMSQHLNTLYQAGILGKRRAGVQIHYRIIDERVAALCRAVCTRFESETDTDEVRATHLKAQSPSV